MIWIFLLLLLSFFPQVRAACFYVFLGVAEHAYSFFVSLE